MADMLKLQPSEAHLEWQLLQQHLQQIIQQAKEQKLCPPPWRHHWRDQVCQSLLEHMPLELWLALTAEDVALSRTDYFKPGGMRERIGFWHPCILAGSSQAELEWEQDKQRAEAAIEQKQQQDSLRRMTNG